MNQATVSPQRLQLLAASSLMLADVPFLLIIPVEKVPAVTFGGNIVPPVRPLNLASWFLIFA